jgi:hypothetical protein
MTHFHSLSRVPENAGPTPQFDRLLDGVIIMSPLSAAVLLLDLIKTFCFTEWHRVVWFRLTTCAASLASSSFFFFGFYLTEPVSGPEVLGSGSQSKIRLLRIDLD